MLLEEVKTALQLSDTTYDHELTENISQAYADLKIAGVTVFDTRSPMPAIKQAVILFCKMRFELLHGNPELSIAVKVAYDEQKAQLGMSTGYTNWGDCNGDI